MEMLHMKLFWDKINATIEDIKVYGIPSNGAVRYLKQLRWLFKKERDT